MSNESPANQGLRRSLSFGAATAPNLLGFPHCWMRFRAEVIRREAAFSSYCFVRPLLCAPQRRLCR